MIKYKNNIAFTLAEVLITLAIIGVIAAISVPSLIQKTNDEQIKVRVKQTYSQMSQALDNIIFNEGDLNFSDRNLFINQFANYMKVIKKAPSSTVYTGTYYYYKGGLDTSDITWITDPGNASNALILANGTFIVATKNLNKNCPANDSESNYSPAPVCASFVVDVNGSEKPNMLGKDYVAFFIVKINDTYQLVPQGALDGNAINCVAGSTIWNTSMGCTTYWIDTRPLP